MLSVLATPSTPSISTSPLAKMAVEQGLHRQLRYLRKLVQYHLVVVIFFENTELKRLIEDSQTELQSLFYQSVAEKLNYEKRLIVKELHKNGIHSSLSRPQDLTVNTINKYLELKALSLI